jgi:hypothetical protein
VFAGRFAILKFPTTERLFDVALVAVRPKTRKLISQQKVDDFSKRQAARFYSPGESTHISSVSVTVVFILRGDELKATAI